MASPPIINDTDRPEYGVWKAMRTRCRAARGKGSKISVCRRWQHSFPAFFADLGPRPGPDWQLERLDPAQGYGPENCRWVQRGTLAHLDTGGRTLAELAREHGIPDGTLRARLKEGWPLEEALAAPVGTRRRPMGPPGRLYEMDGKAQTLREWAKEYNVPIGTVRQRISQSGGDIRVAIFGWPKKPKPAPRVVEKPPVPRTPLAPVPPETLAPDFDKLVDERIVTDIKHIPNTVIEDVGGVSVHQAALKSPVSAPTAYKRIKGGLAPEEALALPPQNAPQFRDPETRKPASLRELSNKYGIPMQTLQGRLKKGVRLRRAIDPAPMLKDSRPSAHLGQLPPTIIEGRPLREIAAELGISRASVWRRHKEGMTLAEITAWAKESLRKQAETARHTAENRDLAQWLGVSVDTIRRYRKQGLTPEEMLAAREQRAKEKTVNTRTMCERSKIGISKSGLRYRLAKRGLELREAMDSPRVNEPGEGKRRRRKK